MTVASVVPRTAPKPTVLLVGPLFPKGGGVGMANRTILSSALRDDYEFLTLDTGRGRVGAGRDSRLAGINLYYYVRQFLLLGFLLLAKRPRIVHQSVTCGLALYKEGSFMALSRLGGARIVAHIHGSTLDAQLARATGWKMIIIRWIFGLPDAILVLSNYWRGLLVAAVPACAPRIEVVPNTVSPAISAAASDSAIAERGFDDDAESLVLFLGNLGRRKGLPTAIEAAELVRREAPQVRFVFAGDVDLEQDRALVTELKERAARIGGISFPGLVIGEQKMELLRKAAMLILPSRSENQPIAILEGMAMGLPIIATAVGGIPETVADGKEGYLLAPGDSIGLAASVLRLTRDPGLRASMAQASRERFVSCFHPDVFASRIGRIYRRSLGGTAPGGAPNAGAGAPQANKAAM